MDTLRLWQSVVIAAIYDAQETGNFEYFSHQNKDFILVCDWAQLNPEWIIDKVKNSKPLKIQLSARSHRIKKTTKSKGLQWKKKK